MIPEASYILILSFSLRQLGVGPYPGLSPKPCSAAPSKCICGLLCFSLEPLPQGLPRRWRGQLSKASRTSVGMCPPP